ncbi:MAG TPA: secondary thiamine-phosphate synthase enzyme YjbQ [Patescibacteria group bacterium]|nr:secondary thiamine-phosphate synthase enzyme YjbQ [Patescibacteria group bacterium]
MKTYQDEYQFSTDGDGTIVNITGPVESVLGASAVVTGQLTVFVPGSTGAITTIEYEPGLLADMPRLFEKLVPAGISYSHDKTWRDGNGFSHLRAALVGPSLTVPVSDGTLSLGTWQQIVFLEFDNKPRNRRIVINVVGE